jgi:hypothetical protein
MIVLILQEFMVQIQLAQILQLLSELESGGMTISGCVALI